MALSWQTFNGVDFPTFSKSDLQYTPGGYTQTWGGGDNGYSYEYSAPSWSLQGAPDWFQNPSNVMYSSPKVSQANLAKTSWGTGGGDAGNEWRDPSSFYEGIGADDFGGFMIKSEDKAGTYVPYKLVGDQWVPDYANAKKQFWNTNAHGYNDPGFLAVVTAALGGALGAAAGAGGAAAGEAGGLAAGAGGSTLGELAAGGLTGGVASGTGAAGGIGGGSLGAGLTTGAGTLGGGITAGSGALIPGSLGSLGAVGSIGGGTLGSLTAGSLGGGMAGGLGTVMGEGMNLGSWLSQAGAGSSTAGTLKDLWDAYKAYDKVNNLYDYFTQPDKKPGVPGTSSGGSTSGGGLGGLLGGGGGSNNLLNALAAWYSAKSNEKTGDKYAELWNQTQASAKPFMDKLQESYSNPNAYLDSPEYKALAGIEQNRLDRQAAATGRLSNDIDRSVLMQEHAQKGLGDYRRGLQSSVDSTQRQLAAMAPFFISSQQLSNNSLAPYFAALGQGGIGGAGSGGGLGGLLGQAGGLLGQAGDKVGGWLGDLFGGNLSNDQVTNYLDNFLNNSSDYGGGSLVDMWNNGSFNTPELDMPNLDFGDWGDDILDWFG